MAEYIDDVEAWVFVAPFVFRPGPKHPHPRSHFLLNFGPGLEHKSRRVRLVEGAGAASGGHGAEPEVEQAENLFLFRTGIKYAVHVGDRYEIVPAIDLDLVREDGEWVEAWVFDVTFAFGF